MKSFKYFALCMIGSLLALSGCKNNENEVVDDDIHPTSILLTASKNSIFLDESVELEVTFNPIDTTNKNYTYTISPSDIGAINNDIFTPLYAGNCLITATSEDGNLSSSVSIEILENYVSSEEVIDSLKESKKMENADLKEAISYIVGGDGMKTEKEISLDSFMLKHGGRVIKKGYGLTECAACATLSSDLVNDIGSVGIPLPRNIVSAFDPETHEEKSYYELGELCITGPTVMKGYYNNQEATDDMIKVHKDDGRRWLHSGDIGYIAPDGQVYHKDRIKRMIIRSGFKVYPSEIENVISKLDYVRSCSVVGVPSEEEGMVPVTFVVLEDKYKNQNLEETIKDSILENISKSELMEYSYPADFEFRDDLPLTPVGKIDFKKLIKEYLDEHKEVNSKIYSFNINN